MKSPSPSAATLAPVIEIHDLRKSYGRVQALDGLTLSVESGAVGLLGPNGAGKTTLIKLLLGLLEPTAARRASPGTIPRARASASRCAARSATCPSRTA